MPFDICQLRTRPDRDGPLDFDLICRLSTHQADDNDAHDDDDGDDDWWLGKEVLHCQHIPHTTPTLAPPPTEPN